MPEHRRPPWLLVTPGSLAGSEGAEVVLDQTESRHLTGSLRRQPGDRLVLADGQGAVAEATLKAVARDGVVTEVNSVQRQPPPSGPQVILALAVLNAAAMDWAVQKAVEVGVVRLVPVLSERTQPSVAVVRRRLAHWQRIARQAIKQCHRPWEMELAEITDLQAVVEGRAENRGLVADAAGASLQLLPPSGGEPLLLVGPEGGFTAAEQELLHFAGWPRLRLGAYTLRAETAAVVGAALLHLQCLPE